MGVWYWVILVLLSVAGLFVGRFLNVCIERLTSEDPLWTSLKKLSPARLACRGCGYRYAGIDNLPVVGWLLQRGRCRNCRLRIRARDPLVELLTALLFALTYWLEVDQGGSIAGSALYHHWGPQGIAGSFWLSPMAVMHYRYLCHMVLFCSLIVASFIDWQHWEIPDASTLPAMAVGVLMGVLTGQVYLLPIWFQRPLLIFPASMDVITSLNGIPGWVTTAPHLHGLAVSIAGLLAGGGIVWAVRILGQWSLKREAMGFGDVVLMAMIGSFIGWQPVLAVFVLAPVCAMIKVIVCWLVWRDRELQFGPYLSLATVIIILAWPKFGPAIETIFSMGVLMLVFLAILLSMLTVSLTLLRGIQRMFGWEPAEELVEEWTPGDQLAYLQSTVHEPDDGQWKRSLWQGIRSGQGSAFRGEWQQGGK